MPASRRRWVKICGNRYFADSFAVAAMEPDFMGWIVSPRSRRRIPAADLARILPLLRARHPRIRHVLVCAANPVSEIRALCARARPDFVQIVEGPGFLNFLDRLAGRPGVVPVFRPQAALTGAEAVFRQRGAFFLLDAFVPGMAGGTGQQIPPDFLNSVPRPYMIAGGLTPENVSAVLARTGARGADASSGLEYAGQPGHKDLDRVRRFIAAIRSVASDTF
ncbi:MAG: phosphoribosylanthranilate isomerase [Spirochaetales bacterium]|nr:phosphoribosylanthranilate isomerase [Spirochaetales bacterium]